MPTRQIVFTTRSLEALKPQAGTYDVRESGGEGRGSGLRLRVGTSGVKTFRWVHGSTTYSLGRFGDGSGGTLTLQAARQRLEEFKAKLAAGLDPVGSVVKDERPKNVAQLAKLFYEKSLEKRRKRPKEAKRILDTQIAPAIGAVPLVALDTLVCRRPVQKLVDEGSMRAAAIALALLKQCLAFGCELGLLDRNPAAPLRPASFGIVKVERKRWLTASEIPIVLRALKASTMDPAIRLGLEFLLYTGLRTAEALTLEWRDVDLEALTVSVRPENQKLTKAQAQNAEPYIVPLSSPARAIVKQLRELAPETARFVFYSPHSATNRLSDKALVRAMGKLWRPESKSNPLIQAADVPEARPHDFRRTLATHLSGTLGLPPHVAQLCLGHSLGHLLGSAVAGVYDRSKRLDERRQALQAYADWVEGLMSGTTATVIPMRERAGA